MKKYWGRSVILKIAVIIIFSFGCVLIHSCRKDVKTQPKTSNLVTDEFNVNIDSLKAVYATGINTKSTLVPASTLHSAINFINTLNVDWDTYTVQKRLDGSIVTEFEIKNDTGLFVLKKLFVGDSIKYTNRTTVTFIKFKDGRNLNFFTKVIEDLNAKGSHSVIRQLHYNRIPASFNGHLFYYSLDRQFINGFHVSKGIPDGVISFSAYTGQPQVNNTLKTNTMAVPCTTYDVFETYCEWGGTVDDPYQSFHGCSEKYLGSYEVCDDDGGGGGGGSVGGDTGGGGGTTTPPPPCNPAPPVQVVSVANGHRVVYYITPPGGTGGSGGTTTPCPPTTPVTVPDASNDPCAKKAKINATAANPVIKAQNTALDGDLKTTTVEKGYAQNLTSLSGSGYNTTPVISAPASNSDAINTTFNWDSTNGYTIGFTHDHPNGSGPSPADIFSMLINSQSQKLTAAGQGAVTFYKNNATLTVVTSTNNYVVTISNWTTLQTLYNQYTSNPIAFNNNVLTKNQQFGSYESAILDTFGNSITLFTDGGTSTYYPLSYNSTTHAVPETPCPTQ